MLSRPLSLRITSQRVMWISPGIWDSAGGSAASAEEREIARMQNSAAGRISNFMLVPRLALAGCRRGVYQRWNIAKGWCGVIVEQSRGDFDKLSPGCRPGPGRHGPALLFRG